MILIFFALLLGVVGVLSLLLGFSTFVASGLDGGSTKEEKRTIILSFICGVGLIISAIWVGGL